MSSPHQPQYSCPTASAIPLDYSVETSASQKQSGDEEPKYETAAAFLVPADQDIPVSPFVQGQSSSFQQQQYSSANGNAINQPQTVNLSSHPFYTQAQPTVVPLPVGPYDEDPAHKKKRRRKRRRARMAVASIGGVFVGGIILGPLGAIAGAVSAAAISRTVSKAGERRKDRRLARQAARESMAPPSR